MVGMKTDMIFFHEFFFRNGQRQDAVAVIGQKLVLERSV